MNYNPTKHHRRSIRLNGYDYSQAGLYFITICVQGRCYLFGEIVDGEMILNDAGRMVEKEWLELPKRFSNIHLYEYVVMPNHFHAIVEIVGATLVVALSKTFVPNGELVQPALFGQPQGIALTTKPKTIGEMVGAFKSIATVEYIRGVTQMGWQPFPGKLWHRNYYEHIIRNEKSLIKITEYIINNPLNWDDDSLR